MMKYGILALVALLGGCASSEVIYSNNGVELVQVQASPGALTRGFSVLVMEKGGESTIVDVTRNRSAVESLALPAAMVGAGALAQEGDTNVSTDASQTTNKETNIGSKVVIR